MNQVSLRSLLVVSSVCVASMALSQLRVATWNLTNYESGRVSAFQTAIFNQFEGRAMRPDVILGQELRNATGVSNFLNLLNTAPGSTGDWAAAPFVSHGDSHNAFFYRTSKVNFLSQTTVVGDPRNVARYDVQFKGYLNGANSPTLALYSTHMKSGSGSDDQARRLAEATNVRNDANNLPSGYSFLIGGDFNIQSSSQAAYQKFVGSEAQNRGRFRDPINTPGSWNNNSNFRFVHTQDPSGAGGMDDRHDQILLGTDLTDGKGFDYVGDANIAYSTSTWNDPNHSYRAWGNDGTSFDTQIKVAGNTMVGSAIAQALIDSTGNSNPSLTGGHLPVFLDLMMPGEVSVSSGVLDFGTVTLGSQAKLLLDVSNSVDAGLWGADGVRDLNYSFNVTGQFSAPLGSFIEDAGGGWNQHEISLDTSSIGNFEGLLTLQDISGVSRAIQLRGSVAPVPEPATLLAVGAGLAALLRRRRKS